MINPGFGGLARTIVMLLAPLVPHVFAARTVSALVAKPFAKLIVITVSLGPAPFTLVIFAFASAAAYI